MRGPSGPLSGAEGPAPPAWWETVRESARVADRLGFHSLWLTDHGSDPLVTLGGLARVTSRARLGAWFRVSRRPPAVLAKALATVDVLSGGRLIVALEPDEGGAEEVAEACQILVGMFGGGPFSFAGAHVLIADARSFPLPVQRPHPPIWVGGSGEAVFDVVARHAGGWTAAGMWTPPAYRRCLAALDAACDRAGREPATVTRSLCLSALVGEDEADLERRYRPQGPGASLDEWRQGRLVGTVEEVRQQIQEWGSLGAEAVILRLGGTTVPVTHPDTLAMVASACSLTSWASDPPN